MKCRRRCARRARALMAHDLCFALSMLVLVPCFLSPARAGHSSDGSSAGSSAILESSALSAQSAASLVANGGELRVVEWYVSASNGVDNVTCGLNVSTPCASVGYAWGRAQHDSKLERAPGGGLAAAAGGDFIALRLNACGKEFKTSNDRNFTFDLVSSAVVGVSLEAWWPTGCSFVSHPWATFDLGGANGVFLTAHCISQNHNAHLVDAFYRIGRNPYCVQLSHILVENARFDPTKNFFLGIDSAAMGRDIDGARLQANSYGLLLLNDSKIRQVASQKISRFPAVRGTWLWDRIEHAKAALISHRGVVAGRLPMIFLAEASGFVFNSDIHDNALTTNDAIIAASSADAIQHPRELRIEATVFTNNGNCTVCSLRGSVAPGSVGPLLSFTNVKVESAGDGIFIEHSYGVSVVNSSFLLNRGDCIATSNVSRIIVQSTQFAKNDGAAYLSRLSPIPDVPYRDVDEARFSFNQIRLTKRSAVVLVHSANFSDTEFVSCTALQNGGAMRIDAGHIIHLGQNQTDHLVIDCVRCSFVDCTAVANGGAVSMTFGKISASFVDANFSHNVATVAGGAIFLQGSEHYSDLLLQRVQFVNNAANTDGGAIYCGGQKIYFADNGTGCVFQGNTVMGDIDNQIFCSASCALEGLPSRSGFVPTVGPSELSRASLCSSHPDTGSSSGSGPISNPVQFWTYIGISVGIVVAIVAVAFGFIKWRRNMRMPTTRYVVAPGDDEEGSD